MGKEIFPRRLGIKILLPLFKEKTCTPKVILIVYDESLKYVVKNQLKALGTTQQKPKLKQNIKYISLIL